MTDFWRRVRSLLTQDLNQAWLCKEIGVSAGTFSNWIARDSDPRASKAHAIASALGVSVEYLLTGLDSYPEDLDNLGIYRKQSKGNIMVKNSPQEGTPFYDLTIDSIQESQLHTIKPQYFISFPPFKYCDFCIRASGDGMEPRISQGDIIALRRVDTSQVIFSGEMYVLVTRVAKHPCTLRLVFQDPQNENTLFLRLTNPTTSEENGIAIHKSDIKDVYKVMGSMRQFSF